ncbi:HIT family protein [Campylobacter sp. JMF_11 EL3]|uniref:HIT family protein n=1 Tax=Campylobacter sp. JMF_11 EL3 TaxID=2983841 RepID=UPI0022E9AD41|nr:HIT domain-containing protein [Campylobacter sp. JMF_11 EL3]MDA3064228.1 HIT domain-containing protein [Campylobacter sp. JMF_11 EL3]
MDYICAPWRSDYFTEKRSGCPFCAAAKAKEGTECVGVVFRAKFCFGLMNLYPYNPGAFMVIPYEHTDNIENLPLEAWLEMSEYVQKGVRVLKTALGAKGVNIGMNLGSAAGAGIAEHVHYHLVPRWERDTNFITTIANVRVNGVSFAPLYEKIKAGFENLNKD